MSINKNYQTFYQQMPTSKWIFHCRGIIRRNQRRCRLANSRYCSADRVKILQRSPIQAKPLLASRELDNERNEKPVD